MGAWRRKNGCSYWSGTYKCGHVHTLGPCTYMHMCLHTPFHVTSTSPRRWPSHLLEAVLRPPGALETPEELVTVQASGPKEMPFGQGAAGNAVAGNWVPHFGSHAVTEAVPCATKEGLDPSLGSCVASLHWMASLEKSTGEGICQKIESSRPQSVPGL